MFDMKVPEIYKFGVRSAQAKMEKKNVARPKRIVIVMLLTLEDFGIDKVTEILNEIYNSINTSEDIRRPFFIVPPQKPGAKECELY